MKQVLGYPVDFIPRLTNLELMQLFSEVNELVLATYGEMEKRAFLTSDHEHLTQAGQALRADWAEQQEA